MPSEVRKLRQLEEDNARLRRLVADLLPGQQDASGGDPKKALKPAQLRATVELLRTGIQVSIRRASQTFPGPRSTLYYQSRKPEQAPLRDRIKEIPSFRSSPLDRAMAS